jgi:HD-GYP domain-containing protein (c-di-GMP phosphodiesterase class II)/Tfp pilus assembly protein PilZ
MINSENSQNLKEALYNSRVLDAYLQYCREKYPQVDIRAILLRAGIEEYEIADQGHWFSEEQVDRFYELMVAATGNENLAREAGRYAASPGTLGVMRQYTLGLVGPARAFSLIERAAKNFTRAASYKSKRLGQNRVEIIVKAVPGIIEKAYACQNRKGFFEAIVTVYGLPIPKIEHDECIFKGAKHCRYVVTWERNSASLFKQLKDWTAAVLTGGTVVAAFTEPMMLIWLVPASVIIFLFVSVLHERLLNDQKQKSIDSLWNSADELTEQISINYRNSQLTQDVGKIISSKTTVDEVIASVIKLLQDRLDFDRGLVLLADEDEKILEIRGAFGYSTDQIDLLETTSFRLDNPVSRGVFTTAFLKKAPFLITDVDAIAKDVTVKSLQFIRRMEIQSFIACPIILEGESIGILGVDNKRTKKPLLRSDMNTIMGVAPAIGVSIQNARFLEEQQSQFEATLKILADSIDARDFLTAGHSEQVAEYATGIAMELGQSHEFVQMIRIAALLHDYGKIGIPDAILKKNGRLTTEEMAIIRTHPAKTGQILARVPFKGIFTEIPSICASHHEKWDGSGYPNALQGNNIPFGARIIAVADFYEAITAKRHYRDPMQVDQALALLQNESGKHFEPRTVRALLRYLHRTNVCLLDSALTDPVIKGRLNNRAQYRTQVSAEVGKIIISGSSVDISEGGIFIRSTGSNALEKGRDITLTFSLPSPEKLVRIYGRIAWVNAGSPPLSEKYPYGFGVEFKAMIAESKNNISDYVKRMDGRKTIIPKKQHETDR